MSQGPLPQLWANTQASAHGLWGEALVAEMQRYNHVAGLKVVSEYMPQERNRVTLADVKDQYGLPSRPDHLLLVRQRQGAEPARPQVHARGPVSRGRARGLGSGR